MAADLNAPIAAFAYQKALNYGVPPELLMAMIDQESPCDRGQGYEGLDKELEHGAVYMRDR